MLTKLLLKAFWWNVLQLDLGKDECDNLFLYEKVQARFEGAEFSRRALQLGVCKEVAAKAGPALEAMSCMIFLVSFVPHSVLLNVAVCVSGSPL